MNIYSQKIFLNKSIRMAFFSIVVLVVLMTQIGGMVVNAGCDPTKYDSTKDDCLTQIKKTSGVSSSTIFQIAVNVINTALSLVGIIAVGFFIYGGFLWLTSAGNEEKVKKSKQILVATAIGVIIVLSSMTIVTVVVNILSPTG